jgi:hypothetical protein
MVFQHHSPLTGGRRCTGAASRTGRDRGVRRRDLGCTQLLWIGIGSGLLALTWRAAVRRYSAVGN